MSDDGFVFKFATAHALADLLLRSDDPSRPHSVSELDRLNARHRVISSWNVGFLLENAMLCPRTVSVAKQSRSCVMSMFLTAEQAADALSRRDTSSFSPPPPSSPIIAAVPPPVVTDTSDGSDGDGEAEGMSVSSGDLPFSVSPDSSADVGGCPSGEFAASAADAVISGFFATALSYGFVGDVRKPMPAYEVTLAAFDAPPPSAPALVGENPNETTEDQDRGMYYMWPALVKEQQSKAVSDAMLAFPLNSPERVVVCFGFYSRMRATLFLRHTKLVARFSSHLRDIISDFSLPKTTRSWFLSETEGPTFSSSDARAALLDAKSVLLLACVHICDKAKAPGARTLCPPPHPELSDWMRDVIRAGSLAELSRLFQELAVSVSGPSFARFCAAPFADLHSFWERVRFWVGCLPSAVWVSAVRPVWQHVFIEHGPPLLWSDIASWPIVPLCDAPEDAEREPHGALLVEADVTNVTNTPVATGCESESGGFPKRRKNRAFVGDLVEPEKQQQRRRLDDDPPPFATALSSNSNNNDKLLRLVEMCACRHPALLASSSQGSPS